MIIKNIGNISVTTACPQSGENTTYEPNTEYMISTATYNILLNYMYSNTETGEHVQFELVSE